MDNDGFRLKKGVPIGRAQKMGNDSFRLKKGVPIGRAQKMGNMVSD
jgi:hypothetical protein